MAEMMVGKVWSRGKDEFVKLNSTQSTIFPFLARIFNLDVVESFQNLEVQ